MGLIWMIPVGRSRSLVTRLLERSTGTGANRSNERWGLEIRPFLMSRFSVGTAMLVILTGGEFLSEGGST